MREELNQGIQKVRGGLKSALEKFAENDYEAPRKKVASATEFVFSKIEALRAKKAGKPRPAQRQEEESIDKVPLSSTPIDQDRARELDQGEGVTFYDTENSEISRGAEKTIPKGIDSFGEQDTYSFEEADDFQTNRDRNQNSDLADRFQTKGLSQ